MSTSGMRGFVSDANCFLLCASAPDSYRDLRETTLLPLAIGLCEKQQTCELKTNCFDQFKKRLLNYLSVLHQTNDLLSKADRVHTGIKGVQINDESIFSLLYFNYI